jgi:rod shape-determining protein MreD
MSDVLPHHRNPFWPITLSLVTALLLNWLPWHGWLLALRPDFVALVLLYWSVYTPHRLGIGMAWAIGLLCDVADASLLGQHALAYAVLAYGGVTLRRRIRMLDLAQQAIQGFPMLLASYLVFGLVEWLVRGEFVWLYLLGCLTSALLWGPMTLLLQTLSRPRARSDVL